MSNQFRFNISEPFKSGIDFFGLPIQIITASSSITIEGATLTLAEEILYASTNISSSSILVVNANKDSYATSSISGSVTASISAKEIVYASSSIQIDGATVVVAFETLFDNSSISITSDLQASAYKIAYGSSTIVCDGATLTLAQEIQYASASLSGDISLSTSGTGIYYGMIDEGIGVSGGDITIDATKIAYANSSIVCDGATIVVGLEEVYAKCTISSTSSLSVSAYEIQYINPNISGNADVTSGSEADRYASSTISGDVSTVVTGTRMQFGSSVVISIASSVVVGREIVYAKINISGPKASILATAIQFAVSDVIDDSFFKTLYLLDGKPLTNHGRTTSTDINQVFIENRNWNAQKSRYYKKVSTAGRRSFNLSWSNVPNSRYDTVDYRYARDYIKKLAEDPDVHTLTILNDNSNGTTPYTETNYNVYIRDYSETLVRRDISNDIYLWECNLSLEEA